MTKYFCMLTKEILITKASGEKVPYEREKLKNSLSRAGANDQLAATIMAEVEAQLVDGISSKKIYQHAFRLLRKTSRPSAAKYKLKRALMELGPSGYPFEKYIGEILTYQGYEVQVGLIMQGGCISHEVDVFATQADKCIAVECKFGNSNGKKVDVKVALYIHSRFRDLSAAWKQKPELKDKKHEGWIITNTTFSGDAITYARCAGLNIISWDYPQSGNLKDLVEISRLYPVTSLTTMTTHEKKQLLAKGIVMSKELIQHKKLLEDMHLRPAKIRKIMDEVEGLCG